MNSRFLGGLVAYHLVYCVCCLSKNSTAISEFSNFHSTASTIKSWTIDTVDLFYIHAFKKLQFLIFFSSADIFINGQFFHYVYTLFWCDTCLWYFFFFIYFQFKKIIIIKVIVYAHFFHRLFISTFPNLPQIHNWIPKISNQATCCICFFSSLLTCSL